MTPASEARTLAPWARSDDPGYAGGGNKFDLDRWDSAFFERLHAFLARDIGENEEHLAARRAQVTVLLLEAPDLGRPRLRERRRRP